MTENTTSQQVGIPTPEGVKNVDPELLKGYRDEAFNHLNAEADAKEKFKEVVETVSETTGLKKPLISKWLKTHFKAKIAAMRAEADAVEALDKAVTE